MRSSTALYISHTHLCIYPTPTYVHIPCTLIYISHSVIWRKFRKEFGKAQQFLAAQALFFKKTFRGESFSSRKRDDSSRNFVDIRRKNLRGAEQKRIVCLRTRNRVNFVEISILGARIKLNDNRGFYHHQKIKRRLRHVLRRRFRSRHF